MYNNIAGKKFTMKICNQHCRLTLHCLLFTFFYSSLDINECLTSNPCPHNSTCMNTIGSFNCICAIGFAYNETTRVCQGEKYVVQLPMRNVPCVCAVYSNLHFFFPSL